MPDVSTWERDDLQFPRLLGEIAACGVISDAGWSHLAEEMDLTIDQLGQLFERAQSRWDAIKADTTAAGYAPPTPERIDYLTCLHVLDDGDEDYHYLHDDLRVASLVLWGDHYTLCIREPTVRLRFAADDLDSGFDFVQRWTHEIASGLPIPEEAMAPYRFADEEEV